MPRRPAVRITADTIENLTGPGRIFDSACPGLILRMTGAGSKFWTIRYRSDAGAVRELTLARADKLTASQARTLARTRQAEIAQGADPLEQRRLQRAKSEALPLTRFFHEVYVGAGGKKQSSRDIDAARFRLHVEPLLGRVPVCDITAEHGKRLHGAVVAKGLPGAANRCLALLSHIVTVAFHKGHRSDRFPFGAFTETKRPTPERRREVYLDDEQHRAFWAALERLRTEKSEGSRTVYPAGADAIELLALTACRKQEVLRARWECVDFDRRTLRLPEAKRGGRQVVLVDEALRLLRRRSATATTPWVFPGDRGDAPLFDLKRPWSVLLKIAATAAEKEEAAALPEGLRIHDLRHIAAALAVETGASLYAVSKVLGNTPAAAERYASLQMDAQRIAAEAIAAHRRRILAKRGRPGRERLALVK